MSYRFVHDKRLGIQLPILMLDWEYFHHDTQEEILEKWEGIRGKIPDRIKEVEEQINQNQAALYEEENLQRAYQLNSKIADLASMINDLWIWYRMDESVSAKQLASL